MLALVPSSKSSESRAKAAVLALTLTLTDLQDATDDRRTDGRQIVQRWGCTYSVGGRQNAFCFL